MNKPAPLFELPVVEEHSFVYEGFYRIRRDRLRLNDQQAYDYYTVVGRKSAVMIIAETTDGQLVINYEYRHPTEEILLSLPGGVLEDNESIFYGAQRELLEETGFSSDDLSLIGTAYPLPGLYGQRINYVLARNAVKAADPAREVMEYIHTQVMSVEELEAAIRSGRPVDGILCTALYFYSLHRKAC